MSLASLNNSNILKENPSLYGTIKDLITQVNDLTNQLNIVKANQDVKEDVVWAPIDVSGVGLIFTFPGNGQPIFSRRGNFGIASAGITVPGSLSIVPAAIGGLPYNCIKNTLFSAGVAFTNTGLNFSALINQNDSAIKFFNNGGVQLTWNQIAGFTTYFSLIYKLQLP